MIIVVTCTPKSGVRRMGWTSCSPSSPDNAIAAEMQAATANVLLRDLNLLLLPSAMAMAAITAASNISASAPFVAGNMPRLYQSRPVGIMTQSMCTAQTSSVDDTCSAIIPGKVINDIGKMLSESPDAFAEMSIGGGKLHMKVDNTDVYAVLIEGDYINYTAIIPKTYTTKVGMSVKDFRDAVERAALIAKQGANNLLVLKIADGEMAIESRSEIGDVHETIDILQDGDDLNIAFNVKYLIDVLRNVTDDEIEMNFTGAVSPCTIVPAHENGVTYLVLPVRTSAT